MTIRRIENSSARRARKTRTTIVIHMRYTTATSEKALLKEVKAGAKYARATGGRVVVSYTPKRRA